MKLHGRDYVKYCLVFTQIIPIMLLCLFNFTACLYSQDTEPSEVGMIKAVSGKVWIQRGDKKETAKKTMELKKETSSKSRIRQTPRLSILKAGKKKNINPKRL